MFAIEARNPAWNCSKIQRTTDAFVLSDEAKFRMKEITENHPSHILLEFADQIRKRTV